MIVINESHVLCLRLEPSMDEEDLDYFDGQILPKFPDIHFQIQKNTKSKNQSSN